MPSLGNISFTRFCLQNKQQVINSIGGEYLHFRVKSEDRQRGEIGEWPDGN